MAEARPVLPTSSQHRSVRRVRLKATRGRGGDLRMHLLDRLRQMREQIKQLQRELKQAREALDDRHAAQLLEANEHLVIATLHAEEIAERAVTEMGRLVYASQHDALCGIPNRALMHDRLNSAITLARRRGARLALLFIDLDHFKRINDSLGHATGDEVLRQVARRLQAALRDSDTVCRHGGDEFLVMLTEIAHASDAQQMAEKLHHALLSPCVIGGTPLQLSASIGTAIYPDDATDADGLIAFADAAMYARKAQQRGTKDAAARC